MVDEDAVLSDDDKEEEKKGDAGDECKDVKCENRGKPHKIKTHFEIDNVRSNF